MKLRFPFMLLTVGAACVAVAQTVPATKPYGEKPAATYPEGVPPPVIRDKFTADPHAVVYGDTYYIYPTVDKENWRTTEFMVWSSKNLVDWKNEGIILNVAGGDLSWGKISAWAPAAISRNGKYYFYYAVEQAIGVGVADTPTGPFKDPLGKPLVTKGQFPGTQSIDVFVYIDKEADGKEQAYLYFGQGQLQVFKLKEDMITLDGPATRMTPTWTGGGRFNEGIAINKRKDTYYFSWSENDARSPDYRIGYGTAKSPLGPITVARQTDRIILQKSGLVVGTGHHSIINVPNTDDWYMIYHRHAVPGGNGFIRETCLSKMEFTPDPAGGPDKIKPVDVTKPAFPPGSPGQPIRPQ